MSRKYRKKHVVIEAKIWNGDNVESMDEWIDGGFAYYDKDKEEIGIFTLEGTIKASKGDYIIKGVNGEFYPCKPDIFHKTYEEVKDWKDIGKGFPGPSHQTEGWG